MQKVIKSLFLVQIGLFILTLLFLFTPVGEMFLPGGFILLAIFSLLGLVFTFFVRKHLKKSKLKKILVINGLSSFGLLFFSVLHNLMYALGEVINIEILGKVIGFIGGAFFITGVVVSPVVFLITTITSIIYFRKKL